MAAIVDDLALENYGFGGDHPFDPLRVRLALEALRGTRAAGGLPFLLPGSATDEDLTTVHSLTYVRLVQEAGRGAAELSDLRTTVSEPRTIPSSPVCTRPAPAW